MLFILFCVNREFVMFPPRVSEKRNSSICTFFFDSIFNGISSQNIFSLITRVRDPHKTVDITSTYGTENWRVS